MLNWRVEPLADCHLVSNPQTGALSALDPAELVAFQLFDLSGGDGDALERFFLQLEEDERAARWARDAFLAKLNREGWFRTKPPAAAVRRLQATYFTVTRFCNLSCPYCYQGLAPEGGHMPVEMAALTLAKIVEVNPDCHLVVTGGEPFTHPALFAILDLIEAAKLHFTILTNGTLIEESTAEKLTHYPALLNIQVSLDGLSSETHGLTRGKSFARVRAGIDRLIERSLPFSLAPTIHEGNLHELFEIASFAYSHGGAFTPNNLRILPQCVGHELCLPVETLYRTVGELDQKLVEAFGVSSLRRAAEHLRYETLIDLVPSREKSICGLGCTILDIDANGDVYPCHLLKDASFVLGNIFREGFSVIFDRVKTKGLRVSSFDIPKCQTCAFVATCGGGCRAAAYARYGTLAREDDLCPILYRDQMTKLQRAHTPNSEPGR